MSFLDILSATAEAEARLRRRTFVLLLELGVIERIVVEASGFILVLIDMLLDLGLSFDWRFADDVVRNGTHLPLRGVDVVPRMGTFGYTGITSSLRELLSSRYQCGTHDGAALSGLESEAGDGWACIGLESGKLAKSGNLGVTKVWTDVFEVDNFVEHERHRCCWGEKRTSVVSF